MDKEDGSWVVTVVEASGAAYRHHFQPGSLRSDCGRSSLTRAPLGLVDQEAAVCNVCRRKVAAAQRREMAVHEPRVAIPENPDDRMSVIETTDIINSVFGENFITPNAMYNRIWRVMHQGADPACAPRFARAGKRAFFLRNDVIAWVKVQVESSVGIEYDPVKLAALKP